MDELYDLPDGWRWTTLESVLESHRGGVWGNEAEEGAGYPVLRSTNMRGGKLDFSEVARCQISDDVARQAALMSGDIIVSKSSGSPHLVGLPVLFDGSPDGQTYLCSNFTMRLRPNRKQILPQFLFHFLAGAKAEADRRSMAQDTTGLRNLKVREYLAQSIPLPPLPKQQRIVARIESLFAESRTARDALARVPALLKCFRQSVLASAFRGELTERDDVGATLGGRPEPREQGQPHRVAPTSAADLPELPEGWTWTNLGDLLSFVGSGITPKGGQKVYLTSGIPFIRSQNVYPDGLRLDDVAYVSPKLHQEMSRTHLQANDVLLNITGASIGRSTVVPASLGQANVNQHVCILRTSPILDSNYLSGFLNSPLGQDKIMESQSGVTRQGLNYSQIRALSIPLAPLAEQRRIVAKIESLFAQADAIERAVAIAQKRADKIDQAILARAFRGEL